MQRHGPALPTIDVGPRITRLRHALLAADLDALLINTHSNIRWATGFAGSNGSVLVTSDDLVLFTDNRYAERAPDEIAAAGSNARVVISPVLGEGVRDELGDSLPSNVLAFEADSLTWAQHHEISTTWAEDLDLAPSHSLVEQLRSRKDPAEIARIEAAARIADQALAQAIESLRPGQTEAGFAHVLDAAIRDCGADDIAFDTIVAAGPNGAIPHHAPGHRPMQEGELVIVDSGAMLDGYRSDMTRTFCLGALTSDQQRHIEVVTQAQQAGVEAMRADTGTVDVDAAARTVIGAAGWANAFAHGTGHGVGLDIHELPRVGKGVTDVYEIGTVATVEPGVYLTGVGGVRIEDTCVVEAHGARRLTCFPKDIVELVS